MLSANLTAFQGFSVLDDELPECRIHQAVQVKVACQPEVPKATVPTTATKICEHCGTEYTRGSKVTPSAWEKRRFCSRRCTTLSVHKLAPEIIAKIHQECRDNEPVFEDLANSLGLQANTVRRYGK